VPPFVGQRLAVAAADVHAHDGAGHGVEAGSVDQDIELVFGIRGAQSLGRHLLYRGFAQIDDGDVILLEGLVVVGVDHRPFAVQRVVLRRQGIGLLRIAQGFLQPLPVQLAGDLVGFGVEVGIDIAR